MTINWTRMTRKYGPVMILLPAELLVMALAILAVPPLWLTITYMVAVLAAFITFGRWFMRTRAYRNDLRAEINAKRNG